MKFGFVGVLLCLECFLFEYEVDARKGKGSHASKKAGTQGRVLGGEWTAQIAAASDQRSAFRSIFSTPIFLLTVFFSFMD